MAAVADDDVHSLRPVFIGAQGLRAGWSLTLYAATFAGIVAAGGWSARSLHLGDLWSPILGELGVLAAVVTAALILARVEHRRWSAYGLPLHRASSRTFGVGALWGFLGVSLLLGALHASGAFDIGHLELHGVQIIGFSAFWGVMFLLVGLFEEFLLRGYAQFTLTRGIGFWPAAVLLSCLFGAIHLRNRGEGWSGAVTAAILGLFLCLTLRRTGDLWFAVGFHAAWDWGESFVYSVPDSGEVLRGHLLSSSLHGAPWLTGGSIGPEGSVLCLAVIAVVWAALDRTYRG